MVRDTAFTKHKHNKRYILNIAGASQSYTNHQQLPHTRTHTGSSTGVRGREALKTHEDTNTEREQSCVHVTHRIFDGPFGSLERHAPSILLFWSLLLAGV